jgi:hypothetical protein
VHNGMIDKRPLLIVRCADAADVTASVNFARQEGLLLAVRGGGHSGAGLGICDGGLVLDLSPMNGVRVAPDAQTVCVDGGATWGAVDHATHAFGRAVPCGIISTTGVGGLTLGGGHGYLTRKFGFTIDNLLEVDMVLADGSFVSANATKEPDLFWAVRGGGGNFGVVTSFMFRTQPVQTVHAGPVLWKLDQAEDVMRWYREFMAAAPSDLFGFFAFLNVPPGPPFPQRLHAKPMCGVVWCYTGPPDKADDAFKPILNFGPPDLALVGQMPFPAVQTMFDALYPPGLQWYWKGDFFRELSDEAIAKHLKYGSRLPTLLSTAHLYPVDGAPGRVGKNETAFSYRDAKYSMVIAGIDPDPANRQLIVSWAKEYWAAVHPHSAGGAYVNFMMEEGQERVQATYRDNFERLARIKSRYDPTNLFRVNQNIQPPSNTRQPA